MKPNDLLGPTFATLMGGGDTSRSICLGLSASGTRGHIPQVAGTGSYPLEWNSNGLGSNLEGGTHSWG